MNKVVKYLVLTAIVMTGLLYITGGIYAVKEFWFNTTELTVVGYVGACIVWHALKSLGKIELKLTWFLNSEVIVTVIAACVFAVIIDQMRFVASTVMGYIPLIIGSIVILIILNVVSGHREDIYDFGVEAVLYCRGVYKAYKIKRQEIAVK